MGTDSRSLICTVLQCLRRGKRTQWIVECSRVDHTGVENKLRAERRQVCETIVDGAHDSRIVENSEALREHLFCCHQRRHTQNQHGERNHIVWPDTVFRHASVAWKNVPGGAFGNCVERTFAIRSGRRNCSWRPLISCHGNAGSQRNPRFTIRRWLNLKLS
jgi:hypothetical protein